jgi:probable rRNA maturation factor
VKLAVVGATRRIPGLTARLQALATRLGAALGKEHCTATLMLTDDASIRELNRRFRSKDEPTDVLSFPSGTEDTGEPGHFLGDLAVSLERAAAQAEEHGHGVAEEAEVLLLHGTLHLLGHDHETDGGEMRELETRLATELFGEPRGLIARNGG